MHTNEVMSKTPVRWIATPEREQIKAMYLEGKTPAEIAAAIKKSVPTVYRWLHRLRDAGEIKPASEEQSA